VKGKEEELSAIYIHVVVWGKRGDESAPRSNLHDEE